jgi:hypothetical protein
MSIEYHTTHSSQRTTLGVDRENCVIETPYLSSHLSVLTAPHGCSELSQADMHNLHSHSLSELDAGGPRRRGSCSTRVVSNTCRKADGMISKRFLLAKPLTVRISIDRFTILIETNIGLSLRVFGIASAGFWYWPIFYGWYITSPI